MRLSERLANIERSRQNQPPPVNNGGMSLSERLAAIEEKHRQANMPSEEELAAFDAADEETNAGWNPPEEQAEAAKNVAREYASGLTLDNADELEAGIRTALTVGKNLFSSKGLSDTITDGEPKSISDIYSENLRNINREMEDWREKNKGASILTNLAGGLLTGEALVNATKSLGAGAAARFAPQLLNKGKIAKNIATGTALGAATGFSSNEEDRLGGGLMGGALGGALSSAVPAAGWAGRKVIGDRLGTAYDEAGNFIPIGMREDAPRAIKEVYNIFAKNFNPKYRQQVQDVIDSKATKLKGLEGEIENKATAQGEVYQKLGDELKKRKIVADDEIALDLARRKNEAQNKLQQYYTERGRGLERATKNKVSETETRLMQELKDIDDQIRKESIRTSLPTGTSEEMKEKLLTMSPQDARNEFKRIWKEDAFKYVKDQPEFEIDPKAVMSDIEEATKSHGGEQYFGNIEDTLNKSAFSRAKDGKISGEDLMEARNKLGMKIGSLGNSEEANVQKLAYQKAKERIDDVIAEGISPGNQERFAQDLNNYKGGVVYREMSRKKPVIRAGGETTTEGYLDALTETQREAAAGGKGSLQKAATAALREKEAAKDLAEFEANTIKERATELGDRRSMAKKRASDRINEMEATDEKIKLSQNITDRERKLKKRLAREDVRKISPEAIEASKLKDFINKNKLPDPTLFTQMASSRIIGNIVKLMTGGLTGGLAGGGLLAGTGGAAAALPISYGVSQAAASEGVQNFLTRNTKWQNALREEVKRFFPPEAREEAYNRFMQMARSLQTQD